MNNHTTNNENMKSAIACPMCGASDTFVFHKGKRREYFRCRVCSLVFVSPDYILSAVEEKRRYDLHQNSPEDEGYRRFLGRMFDPMVKHLSKGSRGLDFGSGPGPALAAMFEEAGHRVALYDLYYAKDKLVFEDKYDFITATEVVEHLQNPLKELDRLWSILKPGGLLGIMTKLVSNPEAFASWHYKQDMTHISFFSKKTCIWLAARWKAKVEFIDKDVVFFTVSSSAGGAASTSSLKTT
jgi:SAM-dependent methyltransferase